jgi:RNA polymerase sigma-70 factor, ECF subfamily
MGAVHAPSVGARQWMPRWKRRHWWPALLRLSTARDADAAATRVTGEPVAAERTHADYDQFIRAHERAILNYLWRMTGEEQTAYDLTQEVFLRAWQRFETIRRYEQPRAWLFRVATNLALTHLRRRPGGRENALRAADDPAASDPAGRLAERDHVRAVLLRLAPKRRAALVLREVYELSASEIGEALGMSETAVRMALHRAREQFRAVYLREGEADHA